ncbi:hypothetical protein ACQPU1_10350 [Clostridium paraputrificum]|uniref:hypothetical protein n=1 Tax=Clostridium paraputrificum TaxID=29363 RepID=UPI003D33A2B1
MFNKLMLSDKECENLSKGIAIGVGIGTFLGAIIGYIELTFSAGGVLGILGALLYSYLEKHKNKSQND